MKHKYLNKLTLLNDYVEKVYLFIGMACLLAFITLTGLEIFSRGIFSKSLFWTNELARLTFLWSVFLSAAIGFRHEEHLVLDLIFFKKGSKFSKIHEILISFINMAFVVCLIIFTIMVFQQDIARTYAITRISYNWGYASMLFLGVAGTLFLLEISIKKIIGGDKH